MQTSVSKILAKTGETVKSRFGGLLGIWGIYFAAQIVLFIVLGVAIGASAFGAVAAAGADGLDGESAGLGLGAGMILMLILAYLAIIAIALAQTGSLIAFASPLQRISLGDALNVGFRSVLPLLGVFVLMLIAYFVAAIIVGLVLGIVGAISTTLAGLLGILLIPLLIYVMCRICTVYGVVAVDGVRNPLTAIQRGWAQTGSNVWAILGVIVIFFVAVLIVGGLLFMPMVTSMMSATMSGEPPSFAGMGLTMVGFLVFTVVLTIVSSALFAVIHAEVSDASPIATSEVFG
jgi:hypothetical protein